LTGVGVGGFAAAGAEFGGSGVFAGGVGEAAALGVKLIQQFVAAPWTKAWKTVRREKSSTS
jgi:hypothetical protein